MKLAVTITMSCLIAVRSAPGTTIADEELNKNISPTHLESDQINENGIDDLFSLEEDAMIINTVNEK